MISQALSRGEIQLSLQIFARLTFRFNKKPHPDPEDLSFLQLFNLTEALIKQINEWRALSLHFLQKTCEV